MANRLRDRLRFFGEPKEETFENRRYTLRYQTVDDRKHPEEVKAEGDNLVTLIEIFDNGELVYERQLGVPNNIGTRRMLDDIRESIKLGVYTSQKKKE